MTIQAKPKTATATIATLPPRTSSTGSSATASGGTLALASGSGATKDPDLLLDAIDSYSALNGAGRYGRSEDAVAASG
ncbi:hypothetical protein HJC23_000607 [Cyclotella cryptica]|uniref:Uncharacterized protein n=1 Tax=Cyclotella cryptica TaxID=29204 RepID=A0ABD3NHP4_9STRA